MGGFRVTKTQAAVVVGGLSNPSKMPGKAIGLPARRTCPIGNKLADIPGTPCHGCYADNRGMYQFPVVKAAQARRLSLIHNALTGPVARDAWVAAMVTLLRGEAHFRWHDSGDVFSAAYLDLIVDVVRRTPQTKHWLPTQERGLMMAWQRDHGAFPENLTVRVSMPRIDASDAMIAATQRGLGLNTSSVSTSAPTCPASKQENECRDCRACWDRSVPHVAYSKH
jgi:hypothetical protein